MAAARTNDVYVYGKGTLSFAPARVRGTVRLTGVDVTPALDIAAATLGGRLCKLWWVDPPPAHAEAVDDSPCFQFPLKPGERFHLGEGGGSLVLSAGGSPGAQKGNRLVWLRPRGAGVGDLTPISAARLFAWYRASAREKKFIEDHLQDGVDCDHRCHNPRCLAGGHLAPRLKGANRGDNACVARPARSDAGFATPDASRKRKAAVDDGDDVTPPDVEEEYYEDGSGGTELIDGEDGGEGNEGGDDDEVDQTELVEDAKSKDEQEQAAFWGTQPATTTTDEGCGVDYCESQLSVYVLR